MQVLPYLLTFLSPAISSPCSLVSTNILLRQDDQYSLFYSTIQDFDILTSIISPRTFPEHLLY
jgi:hypothetical protein